MYQCCDWHHATVGAAHDYCVIVLKQWALFVEDVNMSIPRLLNLALLFLLVPLAFTACSTKSALSSTPATPDYVIVGDISGYPEGCNPDQVTDRILQFFAAYNEGNQEQLASFFPPTFGSYSDSRVELVDNKSEMIHFSTNPGRQEELLNYFAERREENEQLTLKFLNISGRRDGGGGTVDFVFVYRRQADDIQLGPDGVTRVGDGRGIIICRSQKIYRWGMGTAALYEGEDSYQWSCADHEPVDGGLSATVCVEYTEER